MLCEVHRKMGQGKPRNAPSKSEWTDWLSVNFTLKESIAGKMMLAAREFGDNEHIDAVEAVMHKGGRREAVLFAVGSNSDHGLRRTNADKRRAVMKLLKDDEWVAWSDREIARRAHVSHPFVASVRSSLVTLTSEPRTYTDKHGNQSVMNTSNIGRKPATETTTEIIDKDTGEVIENPVVARTTEQEAAYAGRRKPMDWRA